MFVKTLPLQWWSKKLTFVLVGGPRGQKHWFKGYSEVQATFLPAGSHHHPKFAEKIYFGVLHHPIKFHAKILTGKFYLSKKKSLLGGWALFRLNFLAMTCQTVRLCCSPLLKKTTTHLGQLCKSTGEFSRSAQGTPKLTIKKLRPADFVRPAQFITIGLYSLMVLFW